MQTFSFFVISLFATLAASDSAALSFIPKSFGAPAKQPQHATDTRQPAEKVQTTESPLKPAVPSVTVCGLSFANDTEAAQKLFRTLPKSVRRQICTATMTAASTIIAVLTDAVVSISADSPDMMPHVTDAILYHSQQSSVDSKEKVESFLDQGNGSNVQPKLE